ncbi:MAG: hypothetical protein ACHQ16_08600 [Candidatus Lutacidiplasmatales archaeon]|jgi:hypothetical protein
MSPCLDDPSSVGGRRTISASSSPLSRIADTIEAFVADIVENGVHVHVHIHTDRDPQIVGARWTPEPPEEL